MQPIEIVVLIVNLISLSLCSGLVFALLTATNRDNNGIIFAGVCSVFAIWSGASLLHRFALLSALGDASTVQIVLSLLTSAMTIGVGLYFYFLTRYVGIRDRAVDVLTKVAIVVTVIALVIIWTGNAFTVSVNDPSTYDVSIAGMILLGTALAYLIACFWLLINSRTERGPGLLRPTFLILLGYVFASADIWAENFSLDTVFLSIAAVWIGQLILRRQVVNPQEALNRDLRLTNQELQRAVNDLAEEKSKTEALNRELITANRYKDEFLATMSHELRTPLNSIVGYSELLMTNIYGELDERQFDRLQRIHRNGKHLTGVIDAILDLNKIDSGRMLLNITDFSLSDVISNLVESFQPSADANGLQFIKELPESCPEYRGDQQRIEQTLNIVLDNAFKFTAQGEVKISLHHTTVKQGKSDSFPLPTIGWLKDGEWAIVAVKDTGTGIAPEDQARIFDRFSQADSSRTREYEGIGLGLTIARKLVELHDGLMWVKSYVGQGSTFFMALPFQSN